VSHENITQRKQTEIELKASYAKLEQVMRAGNVGLWDWDLLTNKVNYSAEWKHQIGYEAHELRDDFEEWRQHLHPDDLEICLQRVQAFMGNPDEGYKSEFRFRHKDGSYRWILAQASLEYTESGTSARMQGSHIDITEHKQIEEKLRESESKLNFLVSNSPVTIYTCEAEPPFAATYISPNITHTLGYSSDQFIQHPDFWASNIHPEDQSRIFEHLTHLLEQDALQHEYRFRLKDGSYHWMHDDFRLIRNEVGEPTAMVGYWVDITERKQTEIELQQAKEQAEAANQAKSEFLANMSHEIRTPMNAILGFSDILTDLITDTTQRYYLDAIYRSGKTLLQLINDILDLSKIEAGKFTLQYSPVSVRALIDDISIVFSQKANDKSIGFSVLIDEKLPEKLLLDEIRLRQVILNLVH
jgi:PAS domain S-box-containing protein